jgi:hypothetical protein
MVERVLDQLMGSGWLGRGERSIQWTSGVGKAKIQRDSGDVVHGYVGLGRWREGDERMWWVKVKNLPRNRTRLSSLGTQRTHYTPPLAKNPYPRSQNLTKLIKHKLCFTSTTL